MTARFDRAWAKASRANLAASVGFLLALSASRSASAALATPEQRRARTPEEAKPRSCNRWNLMAPRAGLP